jgi:regulation of enolase protein 1 (concanavalin A-like superfamily)
MRRYTMEAGRMVRQNAENWVECGTEFFDGQRHAGVVFTPGFSDWSTMPDLSRTAPIWWRAVGKKDSIEHCVRWMVRTLLRFQEYFVPGVEANPGNHVCRSRRTGFAAAFDDLQLEIG